MPADIGKTGNTAALLSGLNLLSENVYLILPDRTPQTAKEMFFYHRTVRYGTEI